LNWRVGRAVRQRGANASSPPGCTGSIPVLSAITRTRSVIPSRSIGSCKTDSAGRTLQRRLPRPLRLFHSCGRGVVGCVPVFQTGGVRFAPGRPRQPAIAWCQGYGAFNAGLRGLNSRWQDQLTGASPSWPRRRILIPVTAGSSPAALANFSRGLGREGAGSHKAGVAGSTPVPATISGVAIQSLLISFNGRTLGCGPGDAEFDSPSQDQIPV